MPLIASEITNETDKSDAYREISKDINETGKDNPKEIMNP